MLHEIAAFLCSQRFAVQEQFHFGGVGIYLHKYVLVLAVVPFVACVVPLPASNPSRTGSVGEASVGIHPELTFLFRYCYNMGFRYVFPQTFKEMATRCLVARKIEERTVSTSCRPWTVLAKIVESCPHEDARYVFLVGHGCPFKELTNILRTDNRLIWI